MTKLDTKNWGTFIIGELFEVSRPAARSQAKYMEGDIPFVASGNYNNGVVKMCMPFPEEALDKRNCITVSPLDGSAFYQPVDFLGRGGAGSTILILRNENINELNGLFLAAVLRAALTKYSYADQLNSQTITLESIQLPVASNKEPNWHYMENYMETVLKETAANLDKLRGIDAHKKKIDVSCWKEFVIKDIFPTIIKPPVLHARQVTEAEDGIPYVVRTKFNNGIKCLVKKTETMKPSPAGVISFGAENATFFYQPREFVSGRDIYYIDTQNLSPETCKFLVACLQPIGRKYSYNFGLFPDLLKEEKIKLPAAITGEPDWKYMEEYMKQVMTEAETRVKILKDII